MLHFQGHNGNTHIINVIHIVSVAPSVEMMTQIGEEILVRCVGNISYTGPIDNEINQKFLAFVKARIQNRVIKTVEPAIDSDLGW